MRLLANRGVSNATSHDGRTGPLRFQNGQVYFFMVDGGQRIRCAITLEALELFDRQLNRQGGACVTCFDAHRGKIERAAGLKYDKLEAEPDGTIMVKKWDLNPFGA
jgi:hypothetical protein